MKDSIMQRYAHAMSRLFAEYGKRYTPRLINSHYGVTVERTPGFTILWRDEPGKRILALYDWRGKIVFDVTDGVADYQIDGEKRYVVDQFLAFAPEIVFVQKAEVLSECRE